MTKFTAAQAHATRESWLVAAARLLDKEVFQPAGYSAPANIRFAIGFPSTGLKGKRIGECWSEGCSGDQTFEIFLHPEMADPARVTDVLAHEMIHATVGLEAKHGPKFKKCAKAIGLTGKMKATVAGPDLQARLVSITDRLGALPHASLRGARSAQGPEKGRMLKASCPECGYTVRVTRKWLDVGAPHCPIHGEMEADA